VFVFPRVTLVQKRQSPPAALAVRESEGVAQVPNQNLPSPIRPRLKAKAKAWKSACDVSDAKMREFCITQYLVLLGILGISLLYLSYSAVLSGQPPLLLTGPISTSVQQATVLCPFPSLCLQSPALPAFFPFPLPQSHDTSSSSMTIEASTRRSRRWETLL
jgi:hypothetical protein